MQQRYNVIQGDVLATLKNLPADYFDACLSDPPYGISFMGKEWDKGVPSSEVYAELLRVLKPGAMGLHFGGARMWHRLACNLEEAGFELRDTVMWLYGSGFPKSHNISKAIDKHGGQAVGWFGPWLRKWREERGLSSNDIGALFPSKSGKPTGCVRNWELGLSMPTAEQFSLICDKFGLPFASIEEAEREVVGHQDGTLLAVAPGQDNDRAQTTIAITAPATDAAKQWDGWGTALKPAWEPALLVQKPLAGTFANNALTHGCGALNIDGCRVGDEVRTNPPGLARWNDYRHGAGKYPTPDVEPTTATGRFPANLILDDEAGEALGDAQRFFYTAKVSTKERNAGLADFADKEWAADGACVPERERRPFNPSKNNHPTLKPIALTEYLARLLLVPARKDGAPRRLLVPFSGAGSEMIGALKAGWDEVWGIELDGDFVRIACARIEHHTGAYALELAEAA